MAKPELHFINTGSTFPYPYYLAVMSAIKTQDVSKINLWTTIEPSGKYYGLIKDKVNVTWVKPSAYLVLKDETEHIRNAHIKDYLQWQILYDKGGIYMDLDVICIKNVADLYDDKKVRVFPDNPEDLRLNIAIVMAPPKTNFMAGMVDDATKKITIQRKIEWNEIGGQMLIDHVAAHPLDVIISDYGLAGHVVGAELSGMFNEYVPFYNKDVRVAHLFALANKAYFDAVNDNYIELRNTVYACAVRNVLTPTEWDTRPWELIKDIGGRQQLFYEPDVNGYPMFLLNTEPYLSVSCKYNHVWEPLTTDFIKKNLKEGQTFIDVGANVGYYTVLASKIVGKTGHIYAFEPCEKAIGPLKANLALNNCTNVTLIEKAAAVCKGIAELYMWGETNAHMQYSLVHQTKQHQQVETTSVDEIVPLDKPYYMVKVDVDGGEMLVLDGMRKLLAANVPIDMVIEDVTGETVKRLEKVYGAKLVGEEKPAYNYWYQLRTPVWVNMWLGNRGQHYRPMFDYLVSHDCFNILEIGTNNGDNAICMIKTAAIKVPEDKIHYYGFDLFEDLTPELVKKELSFEKSANAIEVYKKIEKLTKAKAILSKGDTNKTLNIFDDLPKMDFIYIDGGHAIDTIRNDWAHCSNRIKPDGVIFLDDYFPNKPGFGCAFLIGEIDKDRFSVEILPTIDTYHNPDGDLMSQLVRILPKKSALQAISTDDWQKHNGWEEQWWADCVNTYDEQVKQQVYAERMKLIQFAKYTSEFEYNGVKYGKGNTYFDMQGKSILDIGGGPVSLLLRCKNFKRAVVLDPCNYPEWVKDRYKAAGIELIKKCAEDSVIIDWFDEVWIYNVLQHVKDPLEVVRFAKRSGNKVRVCEPLNIGECMGHPHNLTKEMLDKAFGKVGLTENVDDILKGNMYFGVFSYER